MRVLFIALAICALAFLMNVAGDLSAPQPARAAPAATARISVAIPPPLPEVLRTQTAAAQPARAPRRSRTPSSAARRAHAAPLTPIALVGQPSGPPSSGARPATVDEKSI
ncbi:MAG: hypothetical protein AB7J28_02315 [Hyphomonadaceae bacterium]